MTKFEKEMMFRFLSVIMELGFMLAFSKARTSRAEDSILSQVDNLQQVYRQWLESKKD